MGCGVRLLKSQQVRDGTMDLTEDFRITKKLDEEYARTRLQGGEVLLNLPELAEATDLVFWIAVARTTV